MATESELRMIPAPEFKMAGITPIAVEKYTNGTWKRIGYAAGFGPTSPIVSIEQWTEAVKKAAFNHGNHYT